MLKFSGPWDKDWASVWKQKKRLTNGTGFKEWDIPTVDEVDEFNAAADEDLIRLILKKDVAAYGWCFNPEPEDARMARLKPIPEQQFLPTPQEREQPRVRNNSWLARHQVRIESKRIRADKDARKRAEETLYKHWKTVHKSWFDAEPYRSKYRFNGKATPSEQLKLTNRQRIFFHALVTQGYNRESALALARQFIPSKTQQERQAND